MTPKEKAEQLFIKFSNAANSYIEGKKCAIIAVHEILNCDTNNMMIQYQRKHCDYWEKVLEEIKNK